jgi:hypothetical protein
MQGAALSPLAAWQNFYVIIGSAAATLTGLMFVVITLIAGVARTRVTQPRDGIAVFSTPNVVHFCAVLLIAAILSAPWQALWNASLLLGFSGLVAVTYIIILLKRARRQTSYQPVLEDWLCHTVLPLLSYTALFIAAVVLPRSPAPALFVIAAVTLMLLFIGIHNAWDNVTYTVIELTRPQDKSQD